MVVIFIIYFLLNQMPTFEECESIGADFLQCLIKNKSDFEPCGLIESTLGKCNETLRAMKGVPKNASYCHDEIFDYAKCSVTMNTSLCSAQYTQLHECKLRRKRFLFGEDLGLVDLNPQARKRW